MNLKIYIKIFIHIFNIYGRKISVSLKISMDNFQKFIEFSNFSRLNIWKRYQNKRYFRFHDFKTFPYCHLLKVTSGSLHVTCTLFFFGRPSSVHTCNCYSIESQRHDMTARVLVREPRCHTVTKHFYSFHQTPTTERATCRFNSQRAEGRQFFGGGKHRVQIRASSAGRRPFSWRWPGVEFNCSPESSSGSVQYLWKRDKGWCDTHINRGPWTGTRLLTWAVGFVEFKDFIYQILNFE